MQLLLVPSGGRSSCSSSTSTSTTQKGHEPTSFDRCRSCARALRSTTLGSCSTSASITQKGRELRSLDAWIDAAPALVPQVDDHRVLLRLQRLPQKGRELRSVDRCRSCARALRSTTLGSCSTSTSIAQKGCELRSLDAWIDAAPACALRWTIIVFFFDFDVYHTERRRFGCIWPSIVCI